MFPEFTSKKKKKRLNHVMDKGGSRDSPDSFFMEKKGGRSCWIIVCSTHGEGAGDLSPNIPQVL